MKKGRKEKQDCYKRKVVIFSGGERDEEREKEKIDRKKNIEKRY